MAFANQFLNKDIVVRKLSLIFSALLLNGIAFADIEVKQIRQLPQSITIGSKDVSFDGGYLIAINSDEPINSENILFSNCSSLSVLAEPLNSLPEADYHLKGEGCLEHPIGSEGEFVFDIIGSISGEHTQISVPYKIDWSDLYQPYFYNFGQVIRYDLPGTVFLDFTKWGG